MVSKEMAFIGLAQKYEQMAEELKKVRELLEESMRDMGIDSYAQDKNTLAVYKIIKPQGTFIYYRDIDYKRTALEGEKGGTVLSKKEAEEAGFTLKK